VTEAQFQQAVTDLCDWYGLRWHHEVDSRKSKRGFPDLVITGPGGLVFVELKTQKGKVTPEQREWLLALRAAGVRAYVWRPSDMPEITAYLRSLSR
jgi:hypothetical protein